MKQLAYRIATISYCPDLTDPRAVSVPVAALLVSRDANSKWTAVAMGFDLSHFGLDPLAEALLADLPGLVRRTLDTAMKSISTDGATPEQVLREFHELLRTSVHVSKISEERELHLADGIAAARELFELTTRELLSALLPPPAARPNLDVPPAYVLWHPALETERHRSVR